MIYFRQQDGGLGKVTYGSNTKDLELTSDPFELHEIRKEIALIVKSQTFGVNSKITNPALPKAKTALLVVVK